MKLDVVNLTKTLVAYPSESQTSNVEVTQHIAGVLDQLGFHLEAVPYTDAAGVAKLSIVGKLGTGKGGLALMSHDDVVPANPADGWHRDPYDPYEASGKLYGRGTCDMKGPLAASICAAARFKAADLTAPLYIVVTADEEVHAIGAQKVAAHSEVFAEASTGCGIICEPTGLRVVHAHKGTLSIRVTSRGRAAHTSTLKGLNANLKMIPFLGEMKAINEQVMIDPSFRNEAFAPPHSEWSIGINDHNRATNITPVQSVCTINYRPMPGIDVDGLIDRTRQSAANHGLEFELRHRGEPLYTAVDAPLVRTALDLTGSHQPTTVAYGTDGMAFVEKMKQMIVLGPGDIAQAHTANEWIDVAQLRASVDLYARFIEHLCV